MEDLATAVCQSRGRLQRQPGLAHTTGTAHGDEPRLGDEFDHAADLCVAADEAGGRPRYGRGARLCHLRRHPVGEDLVLEVVQLRCRLEPTLGELFPPALVEVQRVGVPAFPVTRLHQQRSGVFAPGMLIEDRRDIGRSRGRVPGGQQQLASLLDRCQAQLIEPGRFGLRELPVGHLSEGRATPQRQRVLQPKHSPRHIRLHRGRDQVLEARRVQLVSIEFQSIATPARHEVIGREEPAESGDLGPQRSSRVIGQVITPQPVHESISRDDVAMLDDQLRQ